MEKQQSLAYEWNQRPGWTTTGIDEVDSRLVAALIDPHGDTTGHWRSDLEAVEYRMFYERGFVGDVEEHRRIYDPVLANTVFVAVGWEPTSTVLSVCRLMFSDPMVPIPVLAAVDAGCMQIDDVPGLAAARSRPGAAVEATIVSVPADERPNGTVSPTPLCHGLFMAVVSMRACDWILSAVDPGALARAHVHAQAGHLLELVGSGEDTTGIETSVVAVAVCDVMGWLAHDPTSPVAAGLAAGFRLANPGPSLLSSAA